MGHFRGRPGGATPRGQEAQVIPPGRPVDEQLQQLERHEQPVSRVREMRPKVSTQDDAVGIRAGNRKLAGALCLEVSPTRQGILPDDEDLLSGGVLLQTLGTLAKRQPDREPGQPREALPESRNRPAVFAQSERVQQRADAIEQHGGGVLLEGEMLNPGQDEPILSEGQLVTFLRRVGHAEPEPGADPQRPREVTTGIASFGETGDSQRPGRPDRLELFGLTAFLFAARAGRIEAAKALLSAGADVNEALPNGVTPLLLAITNVNYELAADLLRAGADPDPDAVGWSALHQLAWSRQPPVGFNNPERVHRDDVHALDLARQLMALGADPNARIEKELKDRPRQRNTGGTGATPFFNAARTGDVDLMRVLVEYGADAFLPNEDNTTPLMAAAGVGVSPGSDPGTNEEALEAFKFVLELGGNISTVNTKEGATALHGAAGRGANAIVQLLVDRGACLDATNDKGHTPLAIAEGVPQLVFKQQPETAALLRRLMEDRAQPSSDEPHCGR